MGLLHLVNRSPGESLALVQCLGRVGDGDAVLLLEGGVYAALKNSAVAPIIQQALSKVTVYAVTADLEARGITADEMLEGIKQADYAGFVELAVAHTPIQSWA